MQSLTSQGIGESFFLSFGVRGVSPLPPPRRARARAGVATRVSYAQESAPGALARAPLATVRAHHASMRLPDAP